MKVFVLKRIILAKHPVDPHEEDVNPLPNDEASRQSDAFADWLARSSAQFGAVFRGPMLPCSTGFEEHYLLCLHTPWPELHRFSLLSHRLAEGEIFVGGDQIHYATEDRLIRLEGEVLTDWYGDEHGAVIPDLDTDLRRRLSIAGRFGCRSRGCSGPTIREIMPRWIEAVHERPPAQWTWSWFTQRLHKIVETLEAKADGKDHCWFVYEALRTGHGPELFPPVKQAGFIFQVVEAQVDEPGEARQWLVEALPLFGLSSLSYPEFESVRPLEQDEVFASHRGVLWNRGSNGIWLGEIGGDLFHELHRTIVDDVEGRLREHIVESLSSGIEARCAEAEHTEIIEAIDAELDRLEIIGLWFQDLESLAECVVRRLSAIG